MVMLLFLVSSLMASVVIAGPMDVKTHLEHRCGTGIDSLEERELFKQQFSQSDNNETLNLGCVMHFCCGENENCPSKDVAKTTVDQMNSVLEGSGISFNIENVSRTTNNLCASGLANVQTFDSLKAELHQGNASTLNIVYVQTNQGRGLKGMCTMPPPGIDVASKIGRRDGCVVAMDTLPRGNGSDSIDGVGGVLITTTHEMGHWLTLEHVKEAGEALGPGGQAGGVFGRLFRRRRGSSIGNVMEPWSMPGRTYTFNQAQFKQMRQAALSRLNAQDVPMRSQTLYPTTPQNPINGSQTLGQSPQGTGSGSHFPGFPGGNSPDMHRGG